MNWGETWEAHLAVTVDLGEEGADVESEEAAIFVLGYDIDGVDGVGIDGNWV